MPTEPDRPENAAGLGKWEYDKPSLFRLLLDQADDSVEIIDPATGRFLDCTEHSCSTLGYTRAELLSLSVSDIDPLVTPPIFAQNVTRIREHGAAMFESLHRRKDGSTFPVEINARLLQLDREYLLAIVRDITERKQQEEAFRLAKFSMDRAADAVYWIDPQAKILNVNEAASLMLGYSRDELCAMTVHDLNPDFQADRWPGFWEDTQRRGTMVFETSHRSKDGRLIPIEVSVNYLAYEGKEYHCAFVRDITERKQKEEAVLTIQQELQASETRYRTLFECNPHMYFLLDAEGTIISVNQQGAVQLGYRVEELIGRPVTVLFPEEKHEAVRAQVTLCFQQAGKALQWEIAKVCKDGAPMWVHETAVVIQDEKHEPLLFVLCMDIADRKRTEKELQEANQKLHATTSHLRTILEQSPLAIIELDRNGCVARWNHAATKIFGWTEEEVLGRELPYLSPEDENESNSLWESVIAVQTLENRELRRWKKDGTPVHVNFWGIGLHDLDGRPVGSIGFLIDITERKQLEIQFRQAQKMEAVGRLAGGMAHDFNNLLTVINGYSELLIEQLPPGDPLHTMVKETLQAGERASNLTQQLLAFSRRQILRPQPLDLNDPIRSISSMLERLLGETITLNTDLEPQLWTITSDKGHIDQILMNLAVNARDAMPDGGNVTITTRNIVVSRTQPTGHRMVPPGEYVQVSIRDNGQGMSQDTLAHLFEPFFTTKPEGKGTGLGLATLYGIVTQNRGSIVVDSLLGQGSTSHLYFPRFVAPAAPPEASVVRPTIGSETVLVVEDQDSVRDLIIHGLKYEGYRVSAAASGEEALRLAGSLPEPIQVLVTDVIMPHMAGPMLAQRLRQIWPRLLVLFMSGYTDQMNPAFLDEPGTMFIQKPFVPSTLAKRLRELLDRPISREG